MSKRLTVTVDGQHKIGKKLFYTDKNLVHRKAKKAFLTVNGAHRLVYSSGIAWEKWSCTVIEGHPEATEPNTEYRNDWLDSSIPLFDSYDVSSESEYYGEGLNTFTTTDDLTDAVGKYHVTDERVVEITSLTTTGRYFKYEGVMVGEIIHIDTSYLKGTTLIATIEADEGALPESGTLIKGSAASGCCILQIDGECYFYMINDSEFDYGEANDSAELDTAIIGAMKLKG